MPEAVAGASAVENRTRKALSEGVSSRLLAMAQEDPSRITVWLVLEAARAGDKMCWNIVAEIAEEIGVAMANLVNLFNPSTIVFDQRRAPDPEKSFASISRVVKEQCARRFRVRAFAALRHTGQRIGTTGCWACRFWRCSSSHPRRADANMYRI